MTHAWILTGKDAGRVARACYMAGYDRVEELSHTVWLVRSDMMEPCLDGWGDVRQEVAYDVHGREYSPVGEPVYYDGLLFGYFGTIHGMTAMNDVVIGFKHFYVEMPAEEMSWNTEQQRWYCEIRHAKRAYDR